MQVVLSATLSRLLPLQLGFECFQYICLSYIYFAKTKISHSMYGPHQYVIECAAIVNIVTLFLAQ